MSGANEIVPVREGGREIGPRRRENDDDMPQALLEFHSPSAAIIAMPPRPSARYITWAIGTLALANIIIMCVFPLDRVVTSQGKLLSSNATILVQPIDTAIVHSIDVHEGDIVHKGQVLAHLDPTITDADVVNLRHQTNSYGAEVDRLIAETKGSDYKVDPTNPASAEQAATFLRRQADFKARVENYNQQIAGLKSNLQGFMADASMYAGRVKVAQDVNDMRQRLLRDQVGSRLNTLASQDQLMEVQRSEIAARESAVSAKNKLDAMVAERDSYVQNWRAQTFQNLTEAERKLYAAKDDLAKADLRAHLTTLTAREDAVVLTVARVSVGSVLQPGAQLMTLVPVDAPLQVEAVATGKDFGYLHIGDPVTIKFSTFPFTRYGGARGTLINVSADSFAQDNASKGGAESSGLQQFATGNAYYRLRIRIDKYTLHGVPNYFHPAPGMPVTADIMVGKRTMMEYLLSSVLPVATTGMREP